MSAMFSLLAASGDDEGTTCTFYWVRRQFGQGARSRCSDNKFGAFLEDLIENEGFPRPLPHPKHGGGIERGVTNRSQWIRAGVVEWLGDYLPPSAATAIDAQAMRSAADDMDAAARKLCLVVNNSAGAA